MATSRRPDQFKGDKLIISCGHHHDHYFRLSDPHPVPSSVLHPRDEFYTINDNLQIDQDIEPDLEMDFTNPQVLSHLRNKKFSFICFERISIFNDVESAKKCLSNAKELLTENGVCMIYAGGRHLTPEIRAVITSYFPYNRLITYGAGHTWTLVASNNAAELKKYDELKTNNAYFIKLSNTMRTVDHFHVTQVNHDRKENKTPEELEVKSNTYYLMDDEGHLPVAAYKKMHR